jgi:hypothetical protein
MLRTAVLPAIMAVVGVAIVVRMAIEGSPFGMLLGALFVAAGAGRFYVERRGL